MIPIVTRSLSVSWSLVVTGYSHLWFSSIVVCLDQDLAQSNVLTHSGEGLLHCLPSSQNRDPCDLESDDPNE